MAGLEVVMDVFAGPDEVIVLEADVAIGFDVAGVHVHGDGVGRAKVFVVSEPDAVGAVGELGVVAVFGPAIIVESADVVINLLLSIEDEGKREHTESECANEARKYH